MCIRDRQRVVPADTIAAWTERIENMEEDIQDIALQERAEKAVRIAERDANKAENLMLHERDIFSRPKRSWFQTEREKREVRNKAKEDYEDPFGKKRKADSEKDGKAKKKQKSLSRTVRREQAIDKALADKPNAIKKVTDKQVKVAAKRTKKEERMQKVGLAPKNKQEKRKSQKEKDKAKGKTKSSGGGGRDLAFSKEEKKATLLGKLRGHNNFKSKKRYKRR
eukprot:TRINITY_DN4476_c0_g2_i1.p1 TRINITY_DN4476_c0_g2~~TRINITY_DN4476_c0_g2_i1.p1  ORF type:complete len:223 (+),score=91.69 TRINITY_DN4476_c0_g2_i1:33-701(+)